MTFRQLGKSKTFEKALRRFAASVIVLATGLTSV